jgi:type VI secretion system secreted protein Hcp
MNKSKLLSVLFVVLLLVVAVSLQGEPAATAQTDEVPPVDYFLDIDGIEGESKDADHAGEIDITFVGWAESLPLGVVGPAATSLRVQMEDFHFAAPLSKASPKLLLAVAQGTHFNEAVFTARRFGEIPVEFLSIRLQDVVVTSYHTTGAQDLPVDEFTLSFGKITYTYWETKDDGSQGDATTVTWDRKKNALE